MTRTTVRIAVLLAATVAAGLGAGGAAEAQDVAGCPGGVGFKTTTDTQGRPCSEQVRRAKNNADAVNGPGKTPVDRGSTTDGDPTYAKPSTGIDGLPGVPDSGQALPGTKAWQRGHDP